MSILLHERTKANIHAFIGSGNHALLLTGPKGSGKETVLRHIAKLLGSDRGENVVVLRPELKSVIEIAQIRELRRVLRLKSGVTTSVIIPDAAKMQPPAQNALLKLLEEPPEKVYFLLGAASKEDLLQTIVSRAAHITLNTLSIDKVSDYLVAAGHTSDAVRSALLLSDGLIGLASSILDGETEMSESVAEAKKLLSLSKAEKLAFVDKLAKDKSAVARLLSGLERVLFAGFTLARTGGKDMKPWAEKLKAVEYAKQCLSAQVTTRLLLTRLVLYL